MNNKKNLVMIIVAIACFVGAFVVLYNNGVFGGQVGPMTSFTRPTSNTSRSSAFYSENILPFGQLQGGDFDRAFGSRKTGMYKISYPQLDIKNDVSVNVKDLFVPVASSSQPTLP